MCWPRLFCCCRYRAKEIDLEPAPSLMPHVETILTISPEGEKITKIQVKNAQGIVVQEMDPTEEDNNFDIVDVFTSQRFPSTDYDTRTQQKIAHPSTFIFGK